MRLDEYLSRGDYSLLAIYWGFTIFFSILVTMVIKGYRKDHRRLIFAILFQMAIIRLSVPLFDFEDRAHTKETLEIVVYLVSQILTFSVLF